jgi:hypothetical protein
MKPSTAAAPQHGLNELRQRGRMTWIEEEHGWVAAPAAVRAALSTAGFILDLEPDPYTEDGGEA